MAEIIGMLIVFGLCCAWFCVLLIIANARDTADHDRLQFEPHPYQADDPRIVAALEADLHRVLGDLDRTIDGYTPRRKDVA